MASEMDVGARGVARPGNGDGECDVEGRTSVSQGECTGGECSE